MESDKVFVGLFEIDGKRISSEVLSWASRYELHTHESNSRFSVDLYVFNPSVIGRLNSRTTSEGISYVITGPDCASVRRGPLGHPGDGEFDHWGVHSIELAFFYAHSQLNVRLEGTSNRGSGGFSRAEGDLEPVRFKICFVVPNDKLKNYLGLTDSAWGYFSTTLHELQARNPVA